MSQHSWTTPRIQFVKMSDHTVVPIGNIIKARVLYCNPAKNRQYSQLYFSQ